MTFDQWFNELEVFGVRSERFFEDLAHYKEGSDTDMVKWLKAAYETGYSRRDEELMDDGK